MNKQLYKKKFFLLLLVITSMATSCISTRDRETPTGQRVEGKRALDIRNYEVKCHPYLSKSIREFEATLNEYGKAGWQLRGVLTRGGNTYAFCLSK